MGIHYTHKLISKHYTHKLSQLKAEVAYMVPLRCNNTSEHSLDPIQNKVPISRKAKIIIMIDL